jgi:hypothetical protein
MGRPPLRHDSEPVRDNLRKRRRKSTDDKFEVPKELKIPGQSYEWKTESVLGDEGLHVMHMNGLVENGWEPVQLSEMPHFGRPGESGVVRRGGQILMKRPIELTKEARIEDYQIARAEVDGVMGRMRSADPTGNPHMPAVGNKAIHDHRSMPSEYAVVKTATTQLELQD